MSLETILGGSSHRQKIRGRRGHGFNEIAISLWYSSLWGAFERRLWCNSPHPEVCFKLVVGVGGSDSAYRFDRETVF